MRITNICLAAALALASPPALIARHTPTPDRAAVIAALEQAMVTGQPCHSTHGEYPWLQRAVHEAFARNDVEIMRLAQRAAVRLVAFASRPVATVNDTALYVRKIDWLTVPSLPRYTLDVFASWDGGEMRRIEAFGKGDTVIARPPGLEASRPGFHHVRVAARIVFEGPEGAVPPEEIRPLRDVVYAIHDPAAEQQDVRAFLFSPARVSARQFDPVLPDVALIDWLNATLKPFGGSSDPDRDWMSTHCDARTRPGSAPPQDDALCTLAYFQMKQGFGEVWFRTGRIERGEGGARWVLEPPTVEALRLHGPSTSGVTAHERLSALPTLLAQPSETWPTADVSVAPDDMTLAASSGAIRFEVTVRNTGGVDLHGAVISVLTTTEEGRGDSQSFVRNIPRGGDARVEGTIAMPGSYGALLVHAMQLGKHSPHDFWMADPTPDDAMAFRVVNPHQAPPDYAARVRTRCAPGCRGY